MSNTIGNNIRLTVFGESHGPYVGGVIDGLPAGLEVKEEYISKAMHQRQSVAELSTARREADVPIFISGVKDGYTEGSPLAFIIENADIKSQDYEALKDIARPGHADYAAQTKYDGYQDTRGGGHFSGRLTAVTVAAGSILRYALEKKGILIGSHISELFEITDGKFNPEDIASDIQRLNDMDFAVLSEAAGEKMQEAIKKAASDKDSVGGIIETCIAGLGVGIGEPLFGSIESELSRAIFGIGGIKGIEFGAGFELTRMRGSEANDEFVIRGGKIVTASNHNGGLNGGISNGMPIIFRCAVKPTPSIAKLQRSVNFDEGSETEIEIKGRHDPAIVHRARVVIDSVTAFVIADLICTEKGKKWLR